MMHYLIMAAVVAATSPSPVGPSGKWVVDYRQDMCLVSRPFGPADANTLFAIEPAIAMDEGGETLFVLGPNTNGSGVHRRQATVTLQPSGARAKTEYVSWTPTGGKFRAYEFEADPDFVKSIGDATGVAITAGKENFSFATGKMQPVLNALRTCNENLFRTWGVDPSAKAAAKGLGPGAWFSPDSYPQDALRRGAQGRSVIILTVSADGRPTACHVAVKADPALDQTTCRLAMARGRYEASPGKSDRYSILAVRWLMPDF